MRPSTRDSQVARDTRCVHARSVTGSRTFLPEARKVEFSKFIYESSIDISNTPVNVTECFPHNFFRCTRHAILRTRRDPERSAEPISYFRLSARGREHGEYGERVTVLWNSIHSRDVGVTNNHRARGALHNCIINATGMHARATRARAHARTPLCIHRERSWIETSHGSYRGRLLCLRAESFNSTAKESTAMVIDAFAVKEWEHR